MKQTFEKLSNEQLTSLTEKMKELLNNKEKKELQIK